MPVTPKRLRSQRHETVIRVSERMEELLDELSEELIQQRWDELTKELSEMMTAYKKLHPILEAAIEWKHQDKAFTFREFTEAMDKLKGYLENDEW